MRVRLTQVTARDCRKSSEDNHIDNISAQLHTTYTPKKDGAQIIDINELKWRHLRNYLSLAMFCEF